MIDRQMRDREKEREMAVISDREGERLKETRRNTNKGEG